MTIEKCTLTCTHEGYQLAALQNTETCFCGHLTVNYKVYGEATNCDQLCKGNNHETCGGILANQVYSVPLLRHSTELAVCNDGNCSKYTTQLVTQPSIQVFKF